jgi:competence protein ComEA
VRKSVLWAVAFAALAHVGNGAAARLVPRSPPLPSAASAAATAAREAAAATAMARAAPAGSTSAAVASPCLPVGDRADAVTSDGKVVLNLASVAQLEALPGLGPKRAQAIVELRARLGRFRRLEELRRVRGLGPRLLGRLRDRVLVDPPAPPLALAAPATSVEPRR